MIQMLNNLFHSKPVETVLKDLSAKLDALSGEEASFFSEATL